MNKTYLLALAAVALLVALPACSTPPKGSNAGQNSTGRPATGATSDIHR